MKNLLIIILAINFHCTSQGSIEQMPEEIIRYLFNFLTIKEACSLKQTCKSINSAYSRNDILKKAAREDKKIGVKVNLKSPFGGITSSTIQNITRLHTLNEIKKLFSNKNGLNPEHVAVSTVKHMEVEKTYRGVLKSLGKTISITGQDKSTLANAKINDSSHIMCRPTCPDTYNCVTCLEGSFTE